MHTCFQIVQFQGHLTLSWIFVSILDFCGVGLGVPVEDPIYSRTSYIHTTPVLPSMARKTDRGERICTV